MMRKKSYYIQKIFRCEQVIHLTPSDTGNINKIILHYNQLKPDLMASYEGAGISRKIIAALLQAEADRIADGEV